MHNIIKRIKLFFYFFQYLSFSKIKNYIQLFLSYKFSIKNPHFNQKMLPAFISVEPCDYCQLSCPECPVGIRAVKKTNQIDDSVYRKTIDELKEKLLHVIFYFQGEPLLNRNLPKMIEYAHKSGIFTSTSTNAQALSSTIAKEIVLSGLDKIIISIDGATQEVYEKYRIGGKLQKAIDGVNYINHWKKELKSNTPFVEIQFIVFKTNEHQFSEMKKLKKNLRADRIVFKTAQLYDFENGNELLTTKNKYSRYKKLQSGKYEIKNPLKNHCKRMWMGSVINSGGEVLPCCFDKSSQFTFGNMKEDTFQSIWHNKKSYAFRNSILQNRKQHEMCRNCSEK